MPFNAGRPTTRRALLGQAGLAAAAIGVAKARAAEIFREKLDQVKADPQYQKLKERHLQRNERGG